MATSFSARQVIDILNESDESDMDCDVSEDSFDMNGTGDENSDDAATPGNDSGTGRGVATDRGTATGRAGATVRGAGTGRGTGTGRGVGILVLGEL